MFKGGIVVNMIENAKRALVDKRVVYLFLYFFFVIAVFWTLKPLRTSAVVKAFGPDYYPIFKQGILVILPIIVTVYTLLTTFFNRSQLVHFFVTIFFGLNLLFWGLFEFYPSAYAKIGFFFYIDTYITIMVTLFFTYLNQLYTSGDAKKTYAYIVSGGLIGGIVGSSISGWASAFMGNHIILVAGVFLLAISFIVRKLESFPEIHASQNVVLCPKKSNDSVMSVFSEGLSAVTQSKYLLCIVAIVGLYEIVSTIVDYQFTAAIASRFAARDAMAAFHGKVFFVAQVLALMIQYVITPYVHRHYSILIGLLFLPLALLIGSTAFLLVPLLSVITLSIGSEAAMTYSINQSSKEILYVPLDNRDKVKSKAFIDMFVLRGAKALSAVILLTYTLWLSHHGWTSRFLMIINICAIGVWLFAITYVGRSFERKTSLASIETRRE